MFLRYELKGAGRVGALERACTAREAKRRAAMVGTSLACVTLG